MVLICARLFLYSEDSLGKYIGGILSLSIVTILFSFLLQTMIVKFIVYSASDEDKAKAVLISMASNTIVPFYDDKNNQEPVDQSDAREADLHEADLTNFKTFSNNIDQSKYFEIANNCVNKLNSFGVNGQLEKVLFPYIALNNTFEEKALKNEIIRFNSCMVDDDEFFKVNIAHNINKQLDDILSVYWDMGTEYHKYDKKIEKANKYSSRNKNTAQNAQKELDLEWKTQTAKVFGPEFNIPPKLSAEKFFENSEVKRFIFKHSHQKTYHKPFDPKMKAGYVEQMTNTTFDLYERQKLKAQSTNDSVENAVLDDEQIKQINEHYKAIVIPIVALVFSIFFLLVNLVSLIGFMFLLHRPNLYKNFVRIGICIILILPVVHVQNIEGMNLANSTSSLFTKYIVKSVIYYQSLIIKLH